MTLIVAEPGPSPVANPPSWLISGPDVEGNCSGPTASFERLRLDINTAWSAADGPVMWLDAALYDGRGITGAEARQIALALLQGADFVQVTA